MDCKLKTNNDTNLDLSVFKCHFKICLSYAIFIYLGATKPCVYKSFLESIKVFVTK